MKLQHDLYDVYGNKIVDSSSEINRSLIKALVKKGASLPRKTVSIIKTPIINDFKKALDDRRYNTVFKTEDGKDKIFKIFRKLKLTEPILLELKRMKSGLPETYHHVLIMAAIAIKMITDIKKTDYDPVLAASLCLTHDIGKTRIPKSILNKKTELTEEQYQTIKTHPLIGFLLLKYYSGWEGRQYCETAFEHHEKLDGFGYPRGIKKIDRYAQLIAPIDIYDALISKRPYRKISYNGRLAIDVLLEDSESGKVNKKCIYLLINCMRERKVNSLSEIQVSQKRRTSIPATGNYYGKIKREKARQMLKKD